MADIFSVIADPTRRHVLSLLLQRYVAADTGPAQGDSAPDAAPPAAPMGEVSVSELVTLLELSQPTVSKHLKVLRDAGLVSVREVGQHRYYALESAPLEEVEDWLIPFLSADFDETLDDDGIDFEDELDELVNEAQGASPAEPTRSQAARVGERAGQTAALAAERARSIFGGAARKFPTVARGSD
ncbi:ArsR/SmtB family transcription factor [Subtercola sp. YIM 133946]|uniref:ArsR/SmtB family transcription factor n=1 Tax=Subtercola sp. YIM 133946 TaxID=3118909 RepID=UPI002F9539E6